MGKLMAGAGKACLDLPDCEYPVASQFEQLGTKYDECNCRALALSDSEKTVLFMSYDLSDIPEVADLEQKISEATGVPEQDVIIAVTHNHTSPCDRGCRSLSDAVNVPFVTKFKERELAASIRAATQAITEMRPARMGYGEIDSYINANEVTRVPRMGLYCDSEGIGYSDKTLATLKFVDNGGALICALLNHCTHATFGMEAGEDGGYVSSGNFPGITSRFVEDYFGGGAVVAWTSGAAGNQHPVLSEPFDILYTDGYRAERTLPLKVALELMEYTGRQHGVDAINSLNAITEYESDCRISHVKGSMLLPTQRRAVEEVRPKGGPTKPPFYGWGMRSNRPSPWVEPEAVVFVDDVDNPAKLRMELLRIGDVAIACLGAEPFCQIGRAIKQSLPAKQSVVVTHTPGYVGATPHQVGYIVDKSTVGVNISKANRNLKPGYYDDMIVDGVMGLWEESEKGL